MFALACLHRKSLSLRYSRQGFFHILIGFDKTFPAHIKDGSACCRKFSFIAHRCDFYSFIFVSRSSRTNQLCGNQREDIFLAIRQRIKVSRCNVDCGNNGMVSRYFSIVYDLFYIGRMRNAEPENRIAEVHHIKSCLQHIIA